MRTDRIDFPRSFQMWAYTVGHAQLLLRSPKSTDLPTRIDVLFKNVAAVHLPTILDGLTISGATEEEKSELHVQVGLPRLDGRKVFVVRGSNFIGYVIAGVVAWHEDEREHYEASHFITTPND